MIYSFFSPTQTLSIGMRGLIVVRWTLTFNLLKGRIWKTPSGIWINRWGITLDGEKVNEAQGFTKEGDLGDWGPRAKDDFYEKWSGFTLRGKENQHKLKRGNGKTKRRNHKISQGK